MKYILAFMLGATVGLCGIFLLYSRSASSAQPTQPGSSPVSTQFIFDPNAAPPASLIGLIATSSGEILFQSRVATSSSSLGLVRTIQQGESLSSGYQSSVTVHFLNKLVVGLGPDSRVNFVQTLPQNIVIHQTRGSVEYSQKENLSLDVRIQHLLVDLKQADLIVSYDGNSSLIYLDLYSGTVRLSYNNLYLQTQSTEINQPIRIVYNDTRRSLSFKKIPPKV